MCADDAAHWHGGQGACASRTSPGRRSWAAKSATAR
eukprot:CAMPEP_0113669290 /NCGR_PEP_ID=MMETSP0038_2-20120614/4489_1 /TAXON_ID=2898 /ORGANISM="Cryptomonas paramecium" /LENGTH=35 /DNA_ID=CAMNT_0000585159 /DNA_START=317 /DNA_END=421 /DNA_ORIENTATION=- /assembly_acc=CAM_ASM_000170